jgi:hypothetical protein
LICGVGRFRDERDFIPLRRMVVFSICLSWNVLLDFFCGDIVSCSSAETRWAPMLGVPENPNRFPEHGREEQ